MSGKYSKKSSGFKKVMAAVLTSAVCLTAAATVVAMNAPEDDVDVNLVEKTEEVAEVGSSDVEIEFKDHTEDAMKALGLNTKKSGFSARAAKNDNSAEVNDVDWCSIKLDLRGKKLSKKVPAGTVEEALSYLGIELTEYDSMNVALWEDIENDSEIVITRTVVLTVDEEQPIKFKTVKKEDKTLPEGDSIIRNPGKNGKKLATVEKVYINGKLNSKTELSSEVLEEAVDKVMVVGTKKSSSNYTADVSDDTDDDYSDDSYSAAAEDHFSNSGDVTDNGDGQTFTDANGVVRSYKEVLTGSGTAYYADAGALTSTGRLAQYGVVAVNPNIIPYGSKLYIVSNDGEVVYGEAVAGDTGGALMDGSAIVDLFYPTYDECVVFGRRNVTIYILEYGNEFR